ncbi:MAG: hypothetical protein FH748_15735 [Balneolaceae bacterium]|nr:hypothetical protein [Balneolaceae bacterium]
MYKFLFFIIYCLLSFIGCEKQISSNRSEQGVKIFKNVYSTPLRGNRLTVSDSLGIPSDIEHINITENSDAFAIITDITIVPPLHFVNLTDDKYITGIGREGRGPGEFLNPHTLFSFSKDSILVLDPNNNRLTKVILTNENHLKHLHNAEPEIINLKFHGLPLNAFPLKNDTYVATGLIRDKDNKFISILNSNGTEKELTGTPPEISQEVPVNKKQVARKSTSTSNNKGDKFAVGFSFTDIIQIYNYKGEVLETIKGPIQSELNFNKNKSGNFTLSDDNISAYIDLASTSNYLYALYSGKKIYSSNSNFGNLIFIFDWKGNLIKSFELDRQIFSITVDKQDSVLYGIDPSSLEPGIYQYNLSF